MPVSEFSWTSMPLYQPPIFQVYGTKRKADHSSTIHQESPDQAKRQCLHNDPAHLEQASLLNTAQGNNNMNSASIPSLSPGKVHPQLQHVALMHAQRSPSPWPSESMETMANSHHSNQTVPEPHQLQDDYCQGDHIMDVNDELYNPLCAEAAQMSAIMDSDCVPNPQQYGSKYTDAMDRICGIQGGDVTHPSSKVKSYCRPSWEESNIPYVSDYY